MGEGLFEVRIALASATVGQDGGQLLNMLFGNTSIQDDVVLHDVELPANSLAASAARAMVCRLRRRVGAQRRASPARRSSRRACRRKLADLARRFAQGGIDYIKDDHGLADQAYSPFAARVEAVAATLAGAVPAGRRPRYVPSLSGDLDAMRAQIALARESASISSWSRR